MDMVGPSPSKNQREVPPKSTKTSATKVCIVGDSISSNIDLNVIASAMRAEVTAVKAYSSTGNQEENEARYKSRFPDQNFKDVIEDKIRDDEHDILIVQAGSTDITDLKTGGDNPERFSEYYKQEVVMSATNLFTSVSNALVKNPRLKKIVLMKQIPRYDTASTDPKAVKAALALLFNDTLVRLWLDSPHKDRLVLGNHRLECSGGIKESRYRLHKKYDGVHMFGQSGAKAYTESVLMLLRDNGLIMNNPPRYFRRYHNGRTKSECSADSSRYYCPTEDTDWVNDRDVRKHHHQVPRSHSYHCPTQDTDHLNDRDVRRRSYAQVARGPVYGVPTANRFSLFQQENY